VITKTRPAILNNDSPEFREAYAKSPQLAWELRCAAIAKVMADERFPDEPNLQDNQNG
jgi:hypothetical protein